MKDISQTRKLVLAAMFMALGLILPFFIGQIPAIGSMLLPMHLPIFLCGMLCGPVYGLIVGFVTPLLRGVLFGMPALYPNGISMAFELATYGLISGLLYKKIRKKGLLRVYVSLVAAMLAGRIVWGIVRFIMASVTQSAFTFQLFMAGALLNAIPGILLQLVLIPAIILLLERALPAEEED